MIQKIRKSIRRYFNRKAASYLQRSLCGYVLSRSATVYDPCNVIGGWIFGDGWYLMFLRRQERQQGVVVGDEKV